MYLRWRANLTARAASAAQAAATAVQDVRSAVAAQAAAEQALTAVQAQLGPQIEGLKAQEAQVEGELGRIRAATARR